MKVVLSPARELHFQEIKLPCFCRSWIVFWVPPGCLLGRLLLASGSPFVVFGVPLGCLLNLWSPFGTPFGSLESLWDPKEPKGVPEGLQRFKRQPRGIPKSSKGDPRAPKSLPKRHPRGTQNTIRDPRKHEHLISWKWSSRAGESTTFKIRRPPVRSNFELPPPRNPSPLYNFSARSNAQYNVHRPEERFPSSAGPPCGGHQAAMR